MTSTPARRARQQRRLAALALAVATVGAATGYALWPRHQTTAAVVVLSAGDGPRTPAPAEQPGALTFSIFAPDVAGLYPGASRPLTVAVRNPFDFDIRVVDLSGGPEATSDPGCAPTPANLQVRSGVGELTLPLDVPAGSTRLAGVLTVYMPNSVADACQDVTFTLRLSGSATKVVG